MQFFPFSLKAKSLEQLIHELQSDFIDLVIDCRRKNSRTANHFKPESLNDMLIENGFKSLIVYGLANNFRRESETDFINDVKHLINNMIQKKSIHFNSVEKVAFLCYCEEKEQENNNCHAAWLCNEFTKNFPTSITDRECFIDGWGRKIELSIFKYIKGYPDLIEYFSMVLTTPETVCTFLLGTPATGKSLFLDALEKIGGKMFFGSGLTRVGLSDFLIENDPQILLIDEIEKVQDPPKDLAPLLTWIQDGRVIVQVHDEKRRKDFQSEHRKRFVVAAANSIKKISPELLSRFDMFRLKPYSPELFEEIIIDVLVEIEQIPKDLAVSIAFRLIEIRKFEVREAQRIARIVKAQPNPLKSLSALMRVKEKYSLKNY